MPSALAAPGTPKAKYVANQIKTRIRNIFMNTLEIKGDWNVTKGKIKQKWGQLTDNDLTYTKGQADELVGRIQKRTGETREAVEQALKDAQKEESRRS